MFRVGHSVNRRGQRYCVDRHAQRGFSPLHLPDTSRPGIQLQKGPYVPCLENTIDGVRRVSHALIKWRIIFRKCDTAKECESGEQPEFAHCLPFLTAGRSYPQSARGSVIIVTDILITSRSTAPGSSNALGQGRSCASRFRSARSANPGRKSGPASANSR